ncbi:MAG: redox-sensing transcriptional repressor Rex [Acidobacteria bacterium]|nr:MAG: redox-sensing transcriptional repressor Rex [Acidobacteriota bacterium]
MTTLPIPTIERLFVYHKVLSGLLKEGATHFFSYDLARRAHNSAAQVRRDLMSSGCIGSSGKGYNIKLTLSTLSMLLETGTSRRLIVVGLGNIGKAMISHFSETHTDFSVQAAFDCDTRKTGHPFKNCPCMNISELEHYLENNKIELAVLAVPASEAQSLADRLISGGVVGILNFAPVRLAVPSWVCVEDNHISLILKKIAFLSKQNQKQLMEKQVL